MKPMTEEHLAILRRHMVEVIGIHVDLASDEIGKAALDPRVMAALQRTPRHRFVPEQLAAYAYQDMPLPIGFDKTTSQPFIVALMTDLLRAGPGDTVLEVGTGSGYQAAVLARLVRQVHTIEIVPGLADGAAARLRHLGYDNVAVRTGDGYYGWEAAAPFDGIIVTAAASQIPPPLIRQLKPGGRMVIPVGGEGGMQYLKVLTKRPDGGYDERRIIPVRFVPLIPGK
jgi:protein-L-isoaspartate(D-aspartate) O-methyltransferase